MDPFDKKQKIAIHFAWIAQNTQCMRQERYHENRLAFSIVECSEFCIHDALSYFKFLKHLFSDDAARRYFLKIKKLGNSKPLYTNEMKLWP